MIVLPYIPEYEDRWDRFVLSESMNGTFLQSRNFLNYHAIGKFEDCSLIIGSAITDIWAAIPACVKVIEGQRVFVAHLGSTYGGIIIHRKRYNLADVIEIVDAFEEHLKNSSFDKVLLKITPDLFAEETSDLLQYLLTNRGYSQYTELSTYIDYSTYGEDILSHMNNARRRKMKKCFAENLMFRQVTETEEIAAFYEILKENLLKHDAQPVHSLDELIDFQNHRLKGIAEFFGVYRDTEMIAGAMSFNFQNRNVFHIQYSGAKQDYHKLTPMSFLFYNLIKTGMDRNFSKLSWGISTEEKGSILNVNLAETKESYGSIFSLNRTFFKVYQR